MFPADVLAQGLVAYDSTSDSEVEDDDAPAAPKKAKLQETEPARLKVLLPSPPDALRKMYCESEALMAPQDDPDMHGGRLRTVPHRRGDWVSCVSLKIPEASLSDLALLRDKFLEVFSAAGIDSVSPEVEPHLSVSKGVALQRQWIDPILTRLKRALRTGSAAARPFSVRIGEAVVLVNETRTRTFVGVSVLEDGGSEAPLHRIVRVVDAIFADYGLPEFYDPPEFHISLTWAVGDHEVALKILLDRLNGALRSLVADGDIGHRFVLSELLFKAGNRKYSISMAS